ncbi:NIPSNAP family protein [Klebsiella pneumoniae]|uniref:NIPSNAP family protein n=1 Tax=Klebsiella pneumoniae TaxID=573 RepID=A0A927DY53_KLEPN|nr:NIPSNAP family protein [Klebsiella pneumoniae]
MIYEKRTYTINPLKMADWLALYQSDALGGANRPSRPANRLLFTEIGVVNQVVHIWAYESLGRSSGAPRADGPRTNAGRPSRAKIANWPPWNASSRC